MTYNVFSATLNPTQSINHAEFKGRGSRSAFWMTKGHIFALPKQCFQPAGVASICWYSTLTVGIDACVNWVHLPSDVSQWINKRWDALSPLQCTNTITIGWATGRASVLLQSSQNIPFWTGYWHCTASIKGATPALSSQLWHQIKKGCLSESKSVGFNVPLNTL